MKMQRIKPPRGTASGGRGGQIAKVVLSVFFVLTVAFFVAKGCWNIDVKVSPKKATVKNIIKKKKPTKAVTQKATPRSGQADSRAGDALMAIILDDWGLNLSLVKDALDIGRPLTLSVLPHHPHSREIANEAARHGLGVMLHMPMQPKSLRQPQEKETILTTTPDAEIREYLDRALESVPHADGVNNHQGSAATSSERVMRTVLSHLKKKGLFFIDSHVIATTVGGRIAEETGIAFTKRDVFIDNTPTVEAVKQELQAAQKIALSRGRVVVIGHDKKATLEAIRAMVPELEKSGVRLVLAKELLE